MFYLVELTLLTCLWIFVYKIASGSPKAWVLGLLNRVWFIEFLLAMLERIYGFVYLVLANFLASMASFLNFHKTTDF